MRWRCLRSDMRSRLGRRSNGATIVRGVVSLRSLPKTVGFAEKNFSYQKNGTSENGRVGRLRREKCQKNTHSENGRVGRLHREKCQKNGNGMLKKSEFECYCSTERIKTVAMQCTFVMPIPREENQRSTIVFSNVFENFHSRNNALWDL